jgi:hypothetical protein
MLISFATCMACLMAELVYAFIISKLIWTKTHKCDPAIFVVVQKKPRNCIVQGAIRSEVGTAELEYDK